MLPLYAEKKFVLYGYKIGQNIASVQKELGNPYKIHKFPDGFIAYIYKHKNHYLILETDNTNPNVIWSIQIEGSENPAEFGLDGLSLGDSSNKVILIFGKPDSIKNSIDEITKKVMKDIVYYSYLTKGNFSIEINKNKVSSIKLQFNGPIQSNPKDIYVLDRFLESVKSKKYYQIASYLSPDFELHWNNKTYKPNASLINFIKTNKNVNEIFFNNKNGITSLNSKNIDKEVLTLDGKGSKGNLRGFIFKIIQDNVKYEFILFQSFEGWIIRSIVKS